MICFPKKYRKIINKNESDKMINKMKRTKTFLMLHIMLMIYSMSGICSKMAAKQKFLSLKFCICYGFIITLLGFYAIGWQQVIKRLPLTTAFANKAVTVVWGIIWGFLFFREPITPGKVIGALMVVCGIVMYALADGEQESE
jgi:drug/metabolite transporter (DMT)-like permease